MSNAPIGSADELRDATPRRIAYQVRWELRRLISRDEVKTQENLSLEYLGKADSTVVSKWMNGRSPLPPAVAKQLDNLFGDTGLGVSWRELVEALKRAEGIHGKVRAGQQIHDVFLASPMAAAWESGTYAVERQNALDVKQLLETFLGKSVYYAGENIALEDEFDVPDLAAEMNFDALRESRHFVLMYTEPPRLEPSTEARLAPSPSSVWVEAGYALALRRPSLFFVQDTDMLPYCLQSLMQAEVGAVLPHVLVHRVPSGERAVRILQRQGTAIFEKLDKVNAR